MRIILIAGACLVFGLGSACAQTKAASPPYEIVKRDIDLEVTATGQYLQSQELIVRPLTTPGVEAVRQFRFSFTNGYQDQQITHAYTLKKDGTRLDVPNNRILRGAGESSLPGYQDDRTVTVIFSNVEIGDEVVMDTIFEQRVPWFPGVFAMDYQFLPAIAVDDFNIAVTTPSQGFDMKIDAQGLEAGLVQTQPGKIRRSWHFHNNVPIKQEADDVQEIDGGPHLSLSTLSNYADAARLHAGLYQDKTDATPEIKALADRLTAGTADRRGQAKALYEWVANHIKYVDVVLGAGGFTPHTAADVLRNGYGDCKDHVMLLKALLTARSIPSSAVLIRAGVNQYQLPKSASPFRFDHLISYIPEFQLYLDSTAQYAPFGVLPEMDAGKTVLIADSGTVAQTPATHESRLRADTVLTINPDGSADGDTRIQSFGASAVELRALLAALPPDDEDTYFNRLLGPGSTGKLQRPAADDLSDNFAYSAHYHIANMTVLPGPGSLPPQLGYKPFSFTSLVGGTLPAKRSSDYACSSVDAEEDVTLHLPHNLKIATLPANRRLTGSQIDLSQSYKRLGPDTVQQVVHLHQDHAGAVCSAAYYSGAYNMISKMVTMLRSEIVYR